MEERCAGKITLQVEREFFIEPVAEIVVRENKIIFTKRPAPNNEIFDASDLENYFCSMVRLNSKKGFDIVIY